jgi:hypothetical protein
MFPGSPTFLVVVADPAWLLLQAQSAVAPQGGFAS